MATADLAIMRAGSSSFVSLRYTRLPSIHIPRDLSAKSGNTRYREQEGPAVMLPKSRHDEPQGLVSDLPGDEERRQRIKESLAGLARPDAGERLARLVAELAGVRAKVAV